MMYDSYEEQLDLALTAMEKHLDETLLCMAQSAAAEMAITGKASYRNIVISQKANALLDQRVQARTDALNEAGGDLPVEEPFPNADPRPEIDKLGYLASGLREAEEEQWKGPLSEYAWCDGMHAWYRGWNKAKEDVGRPRVLQHAKPTVYIEPRPSKKEVRQQRERSKKASGKRRRAESQQKVEAAYAWTPVGVPSSQLDCQPRRSERVAKSALTR